MVRVIQPLLSTTEEADIRTVIEYLADEREDFLNQCPEERPRHIYSAVLRLRHLVSRPLFSLGKTVSTPAAIEALTDAKQQAWEFLHRHEYGDWGDVCADDWQENELSLQEGFRLLSSYQTTNGTRLWVITEADRSVTTILLSEEY